MKFTKSPVISKAVKDFFNRHDSLYDVIDKLNNPNIFEPEDLLNQTLSECLGEVADGDSIWSNWECGLEVGAGLPANTSVIWTSCNSYDGIYYWLGDETAIAAKIDAIK